ncbi:MAG: hypothetical protein RR189_02460 [Bacilli bacterium]
MEKEYQLFDFESYKNDLINYYRWPRDKDRYLERQSFINSHYADDFYKLITDRTQEYIFDLLKKMNSKRRLFDLSIFDNIEYPDMKKMLISNGCGGEWPSDTLFSIDDKESPLISLCLIKKFFGEKFHIECGTNFYESYNEEEQSGYEYGINTLEINGPVEEFDILYSKYVDVLNIKSKVKKLDSH